MQPSSRLFKIRGNWRQELETRRIDVPELWSLALLRNAEGDQVRLGFE